MSRAMIAKIHVAKKQLGLDDESYRAVHQLKAMTGDTLIVEASR